MLSLESKITPLKLISEKLKTHLVTCMSNREMQQNASLLLETEAASLVESYKEMLCIETAPIITDSHYHRISGTSGGTKLTFLLFFSHYNRNVYVSCNIIILQSWNVD